MTDDKTFEKIKDVLRGKVETFIEKVTPIYRALDWKWKIQEEFRVPNEEDVMNKLYELIDALQFNKKGYYTQIYGLKVEYTFVKNGIEISITFTKEVKDQEVCNFENPSMV